MAGGGGSGVGRCCAAGVARCCGDDAAICGASGMASYGGGGWESDGRRLTGATRPAVDRVESSERVWVGVDESELGAELWTVDDSGKHGGSGGIFFILVSFSSLFVSKASKEILVLFSQIVWLFSPSFRNQTGP